MTRPMVKLGIALAAGAAVAAGGAAWAIAGSGDDGPSATGPAAERARTAAIAHVGGGTVTGIERDREGVREWEVEVVKGGGETIEVDLDAGYRVLAAEVDDDSGDESDDTDDTDD